MIDGFSDGWPSAPGHEWVTRGGKGGSWVELRWTKPLVLDHLVLYERPNLADQVTSALVELDDGKTVQVDALPNEGKGLRVALPARSTSSVRVTIQSVSSTTENAGLAEVEVWGSR